MRINRPLSQSRVAECILLASLCTLAVVPVSSAESQRRPTRLELLVSDTLAPVGSRVVVTLADRRGSASVRAMQAALQFDARRLRYEGQELDRTIALSVNDRQAETGRLDLAAASLRPDDAAFAIRLVFTVLAARYHNGLDAGDVKAASLFDGPRDVVPMRLTPLVRAAGALKEVRRIDGRSAAWWMEPTTTPRGSPPPDENASGRRDPSGPSSLEASDGGPVELPDWSSINPIRGPAFGRLVYGNVTGDPWNVINITDVILILNVANGLAQFPPGSLQELAANVSFRLGDDTSPLYVVDSGATPLPGDVRRTSVGRYVPGYLRMPGVAGSCVRSGLDLFDIIPIARYATGLREPIMVPIGTPIVQTAGCPFPVEASSAPGMLILADTTATQSDDAQRPSDCAAVAGVAMVSRCGALQVGHGLRAITRFGRRIAPQLAYSSALADDRVQVAVAAYLPDVSGTDSVTAALFIGTSTTPVATGVWSAVGWTPSSGRRLALSFDGSPFSVGLHAYRLEVRRHAAATAVTTVVNGEVVVARRRSDKVPRGWWLSGMESLVTGGADSSVLWLAGDGGWMQFRYGGSTIWTTRRLETPTTIQRLADGTWERLTPSGGRVRFDASGRMTAVILPTDTLEHGMRVFWPATSEREIPDSIQYPRQARLIISSTPGSTSTTVFSVRAAARAANDTLQFGTWGSRIRSAEGDSVRHTYDSQGRLVSMTDGTGTVHRAHFDAGGAVDSLVAEGAAGAAIRIGVEAAETIGLPFIARDSRLATVRTIIRGPRTDVADSSVLYLDRFGAVVRAVDPTGADARFERDSIWAATVGRTDLPGGAAGRLVNAVTFASTGVPASVRRIQRNTATGAADTATTTLQYNTRFLTQLDSVQSPEGVWSRIERDTTTGEPLRMRAGQAGRQYDFTYFGPGTFGAGLPATTRDPLGNVHQYTYDAFGNLRTVRSPSGVVTLRIADAFGDDSIVAQPHRDTLRTEAELLSQGTRTEFVRDPSGRPVLTRALGPPVSVIFGGVTLTLPADTLTTTTYYDRAGRRSAVVQSFWRRYPIIAGIAVPAPRQERDSTYWRYDAFGRVVRSNETSGDSLVYDPAGNVRTVITEIGSTTMEYDALNRLVRRIEPRVYSGRASCRDLLAPHAESANDPAVQLDLRCTPGFQLPSWGPAEGFCTAGDTAVFAYDEAGRMVAADNRYARVRRAYSAAGELTHDSLRVRRYGSADADPCDDPARYLVDGEAPPPPPCATCQPPPFVVGPPPPFASPGFAGDFDPPHALVFEYDRDSRRRSLTLSGAACAGAGLCTQRYGYALGTGQLLWVTTPQGDTLNLDDDLAGRLTAIRLGATRDVERYQLDADGRVTGLTGRQQVFDAAGRRRSVQAPDGQVRSVTYGPLGALASSGSPFLDTESHVPDVLGNRLATARVSWPATPAGGTYGSEVRIARFADARELRAFDSPRIYEYTGGPVAAVQSSRYVTGARRLRWLESDYRWQGTTGGVGGAGSAPAPVLFRSTAHRYDVAGRLRATETFEGFGPRSADTPTQAAPRVGVFAESRYDALGRQVRTRARPDPLTCTSTWRCLETSTVTVWDGAQTLAELQTRGTEQVAVQLVHAGGVDVPLAIQRAGGRVETLVPSRDWQGEAYGGWWRATGSWIAHAPGAPGAPTPVDWRSNGLTLDGAQAVPAPTGAWWGSVLGGRAEATGAVYLRARHYDPATGRFLQPDPIGLAGGGNRYGYAGGDPVNFADPFGLCDEAKKWCRFLENFLTGLSVASGSGAGYSGPGYSTGALAGYILLATGARAPLRGSAGIAAEDATFSVGAKVGRQMGTRGWTQESVAETIARPSRTAATRDTRFLSDGSRMDDPATAYINADKSYVVRNDRTKDIVQVSNRNDPNWRSPFEP
ncbi:MAG: colicin E5-related ribonuclease [Gemmatimonadaceae bacterium]|nr:colicin E5-related ribonuclease [Gemmatimonadaceae bacterium]